MATFQFYKKESVTLHLDVDSASFLVEKDQLVEQGFERVGDVIHADNSQSAHEKFKTIYLDELQNFTDSLLVSAVVGSIMR